MPFLNPSTGAALTGGTIGGAPFTVAAGQNQPVWVDVSVPRTTTAGTYTGTYTVTSTQGNATVSLTLKVWNFTLPLQPALHSSFLYWPTTDGGAGRGVLQADQELLRNRLNPISTTTSYERSLIDSYGLGSTTLSFWSNAYQTTSMPPPPTVCRDPGGQGDAPVRPLPATATPRMRCRTRPSTPAIKAWGRALHAAGVDQFITMAPVPDLYDDGSGHGPLRGGRLGAAAQDGTMTYKSNVLAVQAKGDKVWSYNCHAAGRLLAEVAAGLRPHQLPHPARASSATAWGWWGSSTGGSTGGARTPGTAPSSGPPIPAKGVLVYPGRRHRACPARSRPPCG